MTIRVVFPRSDHGHKDGYTEDTKKRISLTQNCKICIVTVMLHLRYSTLSLLALAIAAPGVAHSQPGLSVKSAPGESRSLAAVSDDLAISEELLERALAERKQARLGTLAERDELARVAMQHAQDMARRSYAADVTPEGLSLFDQVRKADRRSLYSEFGSNIAIVDAGAEAGLLHKALMADGANASNVLRPGFDQIGIGAAEKDSRLYVVQIFARLDGELAEPLPETANAARLLKADYAFPNMSAVSWSINDGQGATLMRGSGNKLRSGGQAVEGYLNLDVAIGQDVYSLRGPYVRMN